MSFSRPPKENHLIGRLMPLLAMLGFGLALYPLLSTWITFSQDQADHLSAVVNHFQDQQQQLNMNQWMIYYLQQLFGASSWSAYLPSYVAAILIIWLTYKLGLVISGTKLVPCLASVIISCNPLLIFAALRVGPEMQTAFWLTLSIYGFFNIMLSMRPGLIYYLSAYVGAVMALITSGSTIPGALLLFASILYLISNPWRRLSLLKLVNIPAILIALIIFLGWYWAEAILNGNIQVIQDYFVLLLKNLIQIPQQLLQLHWQHQLIQVCLAAILIIVSFLPWLLAGAIGIIQHPPEEVADSAFRFKAINGFITTWILVLPLALLISENFSIFAVLPLMPLISLKLAQGIARCKGYGSSTWARWLSYLLFLLILVMLTGAQLVHFVDKADFWVLGLILIVFLSALAFLWFGKDGFELSLIYLGGLLLLFAPASYLLVKKSYIPDISSLIAQQAAANGLQAEQKIAWLAGKDSLVKYQIISGARDIIALDAKKPDLARADWIVFTDQTRNRIPETDYRFISIETPQAAYQSTLQQSSRSLGKKVPLTRQVQYYIAVAR